MNTDEISLFGWVHLFLSTGALTCGGLQLVRRKGTPAHVLIGNVYFLSMVVANGIVLFIFQGQDLLIHSGQPRMTVGYGFPV